MLAGMAGDRYYSELILKARPAGDGRSSGALTYPVEDIAGDYVEPGGINFAPFDAAGRVVDWTHAIPIGTGRVFYKAVKVGNALVTLPFGTTTFWRAESDVPNARMPGRHPVTGKPASFSRPECVHHAGQANRLTQLDIAKGLSLEFSPRRSTKIGWSALENRPAYRFHEVDAHAYCHAVQQVNPGALTLPPGEVIEKAVRLVHAGKFSDGEVLDRVFLKALQPFATLPRPSTVTVPRSIFKAADMADEFDQPDVNENEPAVGSDPAGDPDAMAADASDTPPEITDCNDAAAALADLAERLKSRKTLDDATRKLFAKLADKVSAIGEDLAAHSEKLEAKLGGGEVPADDDEPDDDDMDETVEKAVRFRGRTLKAVKRFHLTDLDPPAPVAKAQPDPLTPEALKAAKKFAKMLQPYLAAAKANDLL